MTWEQLFEWADTRRGNPDKIGTFRFGDRAISLHAGELVRPELRKHLTGPILEPKKLLKQTEK